MLTVRRSDLRDAFLLAPMLRSEDVAEVAAWGETPLDALMRGHRQSLDCRTAVDGTGRPVVMFGVAPDPLNPEVGGVWALGSDDIVNHRVSFLRQSPHWVREYHRTFPILMNFTDCRNTEHHRWLRWCGFSFVRRVPLNGVPFYEFVRLRSDNV